MKRFVVKHLQKTVMPLAGIAVTGALAVGCGDKASDPDPVTLEELKGPGKLLINDKGNGTIVLSWTGSNNEDEFDGYNIYGVKTATPGQPATVGGLTEGQALQLLDEAGEPVEAAKTTLAAFSYNYDKPFEPQAASTDTTSAAAKDGADKAEFEALPIYAKDGEERLLPTCKHDGNGKCAPTTTGTEGKTVADSDASTNYAVNGGITYQLTGLKVGQTYCFIVMSTFDGGEKVSQASSNMACVTPKFSATVTLAVPKTTTASEFLQLSLATWIQACGAATEGKCPDPGTAFTQHTPKNGNFHTPDEDGPIYVEFNTDAGQVFVAGKNSAIADLGYYDSGFDDPTLPSVAPKLVLDDKLTNATGTGAPILNQFGYSVAGQSITMAKGHVYVLAIGDAKATAPTTFDYVWAHVVDPGNGVVTFRIAAKSN